MDSCGSWAFKNNLRICALPYPLCRSKLCRSLHPCDRQFKKVFGPRLRTMRYLFLKKLHASAQHNQLMEYAQHNSSLAFGLVALFLKNEREGFWRSGSGFEIVHSCTRGSTFSDLCGGKHVSSDVYFCQNWQPTSLLISRNVVVESRGQFQSKRLTLAVCLALWFQIRAPLQIFRNREVQFGRKFMEIKSPSFAFRVSLLSWSTNYARGHKMLVPKSDNSTYLLCNPM